MEGLNFFDAGIMGFVQANFHNPVTDELFPVITYLGEAGVFWIVLSLVLLFYKKYRHCGAVMLCAMAAGFLIGELLIKNIACRPRPCNEFPEYVAMLIPPPQSFSFPSGHSASSFAAATALFCFFRKWGIAAYILAALIAFSRIFLFVHYPTDVLAGIVLGVAMALLAVLIYRKLVLPRLLAKSSKA